MTWTSSGPLSRHESRDIGRYLARVAYLRDRRTVAAKALAALTEQAAESATTEPVIIELHAGGDTPVRAEALERLANGMPLLGA